MNPDLALQILAAILPVVMQQFGGKAQDAAQVADAMVTIAQKSALAYQQQTGRPLDPTLILQEAGV